MTKILYVIYFKVFHNMLLHGDSMEASVRESLKDTLIELLECAQDMNTDAKYEKFISVGTLVMNLLTELE